MALSTINQLDTIQVSEAMQFPPADVDSGTKWTPDTLMHCKNAHFNKSFCVRCFSFKHGKSLQIRYDDFACSQFLFR